MRFGLFTALLLFGGPALRANIFSFSYAGVAIPVVGPQTDVTATGQFTATALASGLYQVTSISGTPDVWSLGGVLQTQQTITDPGGSLGLLYSTSQGVELDPGSAGMMIFGLSGLSGTDTLEYLSGVGYQETLINASSPLSSTTANVTTFTITAMVEPELYGVGSSL